MITKSRLFAFTLFFTGLIACNEVIQPKEAIESQTQKTEPSLVTYTDTLTKLPKAAPGTIEKAVELYSTLVPEDSTQADSAASALMRLINDVVKSENERFFTDTSDYSAVIDPAHYTLTEKQKAFLSKLTTEKKKLVSDGEGGVYLVPYYETILPSIKAKTSGPVDTYLDLAAKEDTTPTFLDAGLAIEITELADRLVTSEQLLAQKLPKQFASETTRLNGFYTNAMIRGADNTAAMEYGANVLNEEFKKGYDYLVAKYPSTKAAAKLKVWIAIVDSGDTDKINAYLKTLE